MRLLLMGPPGAGKGTQSAALAAHHHIPAIATGDIFRAQVKERTPLGLTAQGYMDRGEYVPDEVTNAMVAVRLAEPDCTHGFLLDGYPRTVEQAVELDAMLAVAEATLDAVVVLTVDPEELVGRLRRRAELEGRADDTEAVVRRRLEVYAEQTAPLVELYGARGLVREIDGTGTVAEIAARIDEALAQRLA
jgi:adenylate kinase